MSQLWIARRTQRKGFYLPMRGTKDNPSLMFFLPKMDSGHLDEFVRSELGKQGVTKETEVTAIVEKAETDYEHRRKVEEAEAELKRLMELKRNGATLMQVGFRKWKEVFYPATKRLESTDGR